MPEGFINVRFLSVSILQSQGIEVMTGHTCGRVVRAMSAAFVTAGPVLVSRGGGAMVPGVRAVWLFLGCRGGFSLAG